MKQIRIAFFDAKPYDETFFNEANKTYGFGMTYFKNHLTHDTVDLAQGYDVVCAFVNDVLDALVVERLCALGVQLIALRCAGYNNVDLKATYKHIHVVRVPSYSPRAVAEHAVALILTLNRKTHRAYYRTREGNFAINGLLGFDLYRKTAGVVGTGRIGRCVIDILKGFGMDVLAYDYKADAAYAAEKGIEFVALDDLYRRSDVITLHCPLTPETQHMINEKSIVKMKDGVMIINTGRGKLIDTKALIEGLKSGKVGSAGLDVYEEEGDYFFEDLSSAMIDDDVLARLLTFPNVLVTAHQGFFTKEALENIAHTTAENIRLFFEKNELPNEICYHCSEACHRQNGKSCF